MLRELANVIARLLSIIFERSWLLREDAEDWKKVNVTPACRKGKEDLGNYGLVSLTSNLGKVPVNHFQTHKGQEGDWL